MYAEINALGGVIHQFYLTSIRSFDREQNHTEKSEGDGITLMEVRHT